MSKLPIKYYVKRILKLYKGLRVALYGQDLKVVTWYSFDIQSLFTRSQNIENYNKDHRKATTE